MWKITTKMTISHFIITIQSNMIITLINYKIVFIIFDNIIEYVEEITKENIEERPLLMVKVYRCA